MSREYNNIPLGNQQITDLSSATQLTVPAQANAALIYCEVQNVRYWCHSDDAPTASEGLVLAAGQTMDYDGDLSEIQFIYETSGAILNISYFRRSRVFPAL